LSILFDCTTDTEHFSEHYQFSLKMLKKNAGIPFGSQMPDAPTLIDLRLQSNLPPLVSIPISVLSVYLLLRIAFM
jgi:hypothetical protein